MPFSLCPTRPYVWGVGLVLLNSQRIYTDALMGRVVDKTYQPHYNM